TVATARRRDAGLRIMEASHGEEALRLIDEGARPDVILMDMQMPGISGIEATRALRSRPPPVNAIPLLGVRPNDLPAWREGAFAAGAGESSSRETDRCAKNSGAVSHLS